jgi:hypothetical protein
MSLQALNIAGKGHIEVPGQVPNTVWQTRHAEPTAAENRLADQLIEAFEQGAISPEDIVAFWQAKGYVQDNGQAWTAPSLEALMKSLSP